MGSAGAVTCGCTARISSRRSAAAAARWISPQSSLTVAPALAAGVSADGWPSTAAETAAVVGERVIRRVDYERMLAGVPQSREFRTGTAFTGAHRERQIGVAKQLFSAMGIARDDAAMRQGSNRLERGKEFYAIAQREAQRLAVDLKWKLITIPGCGHNPNDDMILTVARLLFSKKD